MQIFLFLNDLAGRFPFFDECARYFYIGAVPVLAALFLGQLLLISRANDGQKWRIALSVGLALMFLALIGIGIEFFAGAYHLGTLSPRPFMTRRVHWIVVEPQDNSFPCYEVGIAAIFAVALAFSSRKWGVFGALFTLLLMVTRLYCGTNFFADVAVGALLGSGLCAGFGALCMSERPFERVALRKWAPAGAVVATSLLASYVSFAQTPRFAAKMPLFWSSTATASPGPNSDAPRKATRAARAAIDEGEGIADSPSGKVSMDEPHDEMVGEAPGEPSAESLALSKRSHLFLPVVEKFLRGELTPLARPFQLLDVEVAPVKAGNSPFRCAALRFEINQNMPDLRRQTANVAASLVKAAFARDSQLQNVDVTAILRGDGAQIDGSLLRFAGEEVPVFTASIARQNLIVASPRWVNDPRLDGGSWLRARSRLYINERILPASTPKAAPITVPTPIATPIAGVVATPFATAIKKPQNKPKSTPKPVFKIPLKPIQIGKPLPSPMPIN